MQKYNLTDQALDVYNYPSDKDKCFFKCVAQDAGVMDESSNVLLDKVTKLIQLEQMEANLKSEASKCLALTHNDPCIKSYNIYVCLKMKANL